MVDAHVTSRRMPAMKPFGERSAGNPHAAFDERGGETDRSNDTPPLLDSTCAHRNLDSSVRDWIILQDFGRQSLYLATFPLTERYIPGEDVAIRSSTEYTCRRRLQVRRTDTWAVDSANPEVKSEAGRLLRFGSCQRPIKCSK
jgi:hypothetical protein